jgi:hypothetical protein
VCCSSMTGILDFLQSNSILFEDFQAPSESFPGGGEVTGCHYFKSPIQKWNKPPYCGEELEGIWGMFFALTESSQRNCRIATTSVF